jgi:hypothetical protein
MNINVEVMISGVVLRRYLIIGNQILFKVKTNSLVKLCNLVRHSTTHCHSPGLHDVIKLSAFIFSFTIHSRTNPKEIIISICSVL